MVAKDESGNTAKVPGLILSNFNDLRRFLRSIKHIKMRNDRKLEFSRNTFEPEKYKEALINYNVQINIDGYT